MSLHKIHAIFVSPNLSMTLVKTWRHFDHLFTNHSGFSVYYFILASLLFSKQQGLNFVVSFRLNMVFWWKKKKFSMQHFSFENNKSQIAAFKWGLRALLMMSPVDDRWQQLHQKISKKSWKLFSIYNGNLKLREIVPQK